MQQGFLPIGPAHSLPESSSAPRPGSTFPIRAFCTSSQKRRPDFSGSFSFPAPAAFSVGFFLYSVSTSCPVSKVTHTGSTGFHQPADFRIPEKGICNLLFLHVFISLFYRCSLAFLLHEFCFYRDENRASHIYFFLFASDITLGSRTYFQVNF